jgi:malate dehydrogenase (quinone)
MAALLGGSPGASTSVSAMLELIETCFPQHIKEWEPKIKEMIPSYGESLANKPELISKIQSSTSQTLGLNEKVSMQITGQGNGGFL